MPVGSWVLPVSVSKKARAISPASRDRNTSSAARPVGSWWCPVSVSKKVFFSSRRRHTRSDRDWSSDMCSSDLGVDAGGARCHRRDRPLRRCRRRPDPHRSEEHTYELQSRSDLVCRLLLEKKNKTNHARPNRDSTITRTSDWFMRPPPPLHPSLCCDQF